MSRACLLLGLSLLAVVMALTVVGCATPAPLVSLRPVDSEVIWVAGRASVQKEAEDVRVATAFENQDGEMLAIRVEIDNQRDAKMDIDPARVVYITCTDRAASSCAKPRKVIDPERALRALDEQDSVNDAQAANNMAFHTPFLLLSVVGDVASVASGKGSSTTGLQSASIANRMEHDAAAHDRSRTAIASRRKMWANVALRRTTLLPGGGTSGLVYLPIDLQARFVWLYVRPPDGSYVSFGFEQTVTYVGGHDDRAFANPSRRESSE